MTDSPGRLRLHHALAQTRSHAFEVLIALASTIFGVMGLSGATVAPSIHRELDTLLQIAFAGYLTAGGALVLLGFYAQTPRHVIRGAGIERLGLYGLALAYGAYALAAFIPDGASAYLAAGVYAAISVASLLRAIAVQRSTALITALAGTKEAQAGVVE